MRAYEKTLKKYERRQLKRRGQKYCLILFALLLGFITSTIWTTGFGRRLDLVFLSWNFLLRGELKPPTEVTIVSLDEKTFEKYGQPPLPRKIIADALERLTHYTPKLVIIDFSFPEDREDFLEDERIGKALSKLPSVSGTGMLRDKDGSLVNVGNAPSIKAGIKREMLLQLRQNERVLYSITNYSLPSATLDKRIPLFNILREFYGIENQTPKQTDLINFYGPSTTLQRVTISDLENDSSNSKFADLLNGKVIVFGMQKSRDAAKADSDEEQIRVSYSKEPMFGAEIHATIAANLIHKNWISALSNEMQVLMVFTSIFVISILEFFLPIPLALISVMLFAGLGAILTHIIFSYFLVWIPGIPIVTCFALLSFVITALFRRFLSEQLNDLIKKRMTGAS